MLRNSTWLNRNWTRSRKKNSLTSGDILERNERIRISLYLCIPACAILYTYQRKGRYERRAQRRRERERGQSGRRASVVGNVWNVVERYKSGPACGSHGRQKERRRRGRHGRDTRYSFEARPRKTFHVRRDVAPVPFAANCASRARGITIGAYARLVSLSKLVSAPVSSSPSSSSSFSLRAHFPPVDGKVSRVSTARFTRQRK